MTTTLKTQLKKFMANERVFKSDAMFLKILKSKCITAVVMKRKKVDVAPTKSLNGTHFMNEHRNYPDNQNSKADKHTTKER